MAVLLLTTAHVTTAQAASFDVNSKMDANIAVAPCGIPGGPCTLRAAIQKANALAASGASSPHTITLPAGTYLLAIAGEKEPDAATGDLDIKADVTINGVGRALTTIDAGGIDRVFEIFSGYEVKIVGLTISKGHIKMSGPKQAGGGIRNAGKLTLMSVEVSDNISGAAAGTSPFLAAGGISNVGTLHLTNSVITRNKTNLYHGGIENGGTLTITDSTISDNEAQGTLGQSRGTGGGISNSTASSDATISNTTISGNKAGSGGGIMNQGVKMELTNCTISGNLAEAVPGSTTGTGGAIYSITKITLINTTVTGNTTRTASPDSGDVHLASNGIVHLRNTIVDEGGAGCGGSSPAQQPNQPRIPHFPISEGYNVDSGSSCGLTWANNDRSGVDPKLGPLANNGGSTLTHALLAGSPAIDAVPVIYKTPATDQRGITRPQFPCAFPPCHYAFYNPRSRTLTTLVDIGAYELVPRRQLLTK